MFIGKSFFQILTMGGFTLYIILACSIICLAIVIDRVRAFRKAGKLDRPAFMSRLRELILAGNADEAARFAARTSTPLTRVVNEGLVLRTSDEKSIDHAMSRRIKVETRLLERWTNIVGSIGGTVVYIGLFGTVLGIIRAFQDISASAAVGGGIAAVITGIAEALICTASGIFVAVPSVISYNLMLKKIDDIQSELELAASETADLIRRSDARG